MLRCFLLPILFLFPFPFPVFLFPIPWMGLLSAGAVLTAQPPDFGLKLGLRVIVG